MGLCPRSGALCVADRRKPLSSLRIEGGGVARRHAGRLRRHMIWQAEGCFAVLESAYCQENRNYWTRIQVGNGFATANFFDLRTADNCQNALSQVKRIDAFSGIPGDVALHLLRLSCAPLNHSQVQFSSKKSGFVGSGLSYRSLVGRNAHCWWAAARSAWGDAHAAGGQLPPRRRLPCRRQRGVVRAVCRMPCGREPAAQFGAAQEATRAGAKPLAAPPTASRRTGRAAPLPMPPAGERVSACRKRKAKVGGYPARLHRAHGRQSDPRARQPIRKPPTRADPPYPSALGLEAIVFQCGDIDGVRSPIQ